MAIKFTKSYVHSDIRSLYIYPTVDQKEYVFLSDIRFVVVAVTNVTIVRSNDSSCVLKYSEFSQIVCDFDDSCVITIDGSTKARTYAVCYNIVGD